jgi:hypothetical protein
MNWSGGLGGAAGGAATGAMFGPAGAAGGGLLGGLAGLFSGKPDEFKKVSRFTGEQKSALKDYFRNPISSNPLYAQGNSFLQNLLAGGPEATQAFQAPYLRQFQQQVIPSILERLGGREGGNAFGSSGLNQTLAQAGTDLQERLAALHSGLQMQALPQALGYAQQPYSNLLNGLGISQFENTFLPGQQGFGGSLMELAPYAMMSGKGMFGRSGLGGFYNQMSGIPGA